MPCTSDGRPDEAGDAIYETADGAKARALGPDPREPLGGDDGADAVTAVQVNDVAPDGTSPS